MMTEQQIQQWLEDRRRISEQHPGDDTPTRRSARGKRWSRGDHYRRKNTGIALRTFRAITRWP